MDGRKPLAPGAKLVFHNREGGAVSYVIRWEIGRGGACVVYDASYVDNLGNPRLVRVKECCPHGLRLERRADGTLLAAASERRAFEDCKRRVVDAYQQNYRLFCAPALSGRVVNTSDIYFHNGTVYIVSVWQDGETLAERRVESLRECVSLLISAGKALQRIHEAGFLYLDLKPENILTLRDSTDLVQLFDFDSMIPVDAPRGGDVGGMDISCTRDFAPLEQRTGRLRRLGPHSDVYSLGAVLFFMLWGRAPDAFDCDSDAVRDFGHMRFAASYPDRLYRELTTFFRRALPSFTGDRYATMAEAVDQLKIIARFSDETRPWLYSTPVTAPAFFTARESELQAMEALMRAPDQRVYSLHGVGGIGKSTLVREYVARHRAEYDAVLYLYDAGDAEGLLADDLRVRVNTVERMGEEAREAYLPRKLAALKKLCAEQNILVVVDDFDPDHLEDAEPLTSVGWRVLFVSRAELPEGLCPSLRLGALDEKGLAALFTRYARVELETEADGAAFRAIAEHVGGHTLLVELIGRQIARSYLSLREAAALTEEVGVIRLSGTRVDYVRDHRAVRAPLESILGRLLEIERYTGVERRVMKLLSLFDAPGIPAALFGELAGLRNMDAVNALEEGGWLEAENRMLRLHPVLREYVRNWPWTEYRADADDLLEALYRRVRPEGRAADADKQFPEDYASLYSLLNLARQAVGRVDTITPAGQRLRFRLAMDLPVDRDEGMLEDILKLLDDPEYLDPDSVLRLYNRAAELQFRLYRADAAFDTLEAMRGYLDAHPSAHYLAVYHDSMGNMLHDAEEREACEAHQERAIEAARRSTHPEAGRLLAACLLDRAMSLIDWDVEPERCGALLDEALPLVDRCCAEYDYERYHALCIAAMYHARMTGDRAKALSLLDETTRIANVARDSAMSYIDHLLDQAAVIRYELRMNEAALDAIREAIRLCDDYPDIPAYRHKRFEAFRLRAFLLSLMGRYAESAETYDAMEAFREDSPFEYDENEPLCPDEVREKARREEMQDE